MRRCCSSSARTARARCRRLRATLEALFGCATSRRWRAGWRGPGWTWAARAAPLRRRIWNWRAPRSRACVIWNSAACRTPRICRPVSRICTPITAARARVEIMTIHKAKGLEFDMVVLPALDRHVPQNRDQLLLSHQFARAGRDGMVMAARPAVGADGDRLFDFLRHQLRDAAGLGGRASAVRGVHAGEMAVAADRGDRQAAESAEAAEVGSWRRRRDGPGRRAWEVCLPCSGLSSGRSSRCCSPPRSPQGQELGAPRGGPLWRVPRDWTPSIDRDCPARRADVGAAAIARGDAGIRLGRRDGATRRHLGARGAAGHGSREQRSRLHPRARGAFSPLAGLAWRASRSAA